MTVVWSVLAPLAGAALIQAGAMVYWGGRISARLEAVERRLESLDRRRNP